MVKSYSISCKRKRSKNLGKQQQPSSNIAVCSGQVLHNDIRKINNLSYILYRFSLIANFKDTEHWLLQCQFFCIWKYFCLTPNVTLQFAPLSSGNNLAPCFPWTWHVSAPATIVLIEILHSAFDTTPSAVPHFSQQILPSRTFLGAPRWSLPSYLVC